MVEIAINLVYLIIIVAAIAIMLAAAIIWWRFQEYRKDILDLEHKLVLKEIARDLLERANHDLLKGIEIYKEIDKLKNIKIDKLTEENDRIKKHNAR